MFDLEEIANSINLCLIVKNRHLKYLYSNDSYAKLLELDSPKKIIGKTDDELFAETGAKTCRIGDEFILNGGNLVNHPEVIVTKNNQSLSIFTTKNTLVKSGSIKIVASFFMSANTTSVISQELMYYDENKKNYPFTLGNKRLYFTKREYEVFKKLFLGLSTKQIGMQLSLSPRTVEDYLAKIKQKLQCPYKFNIIETAIKYNIIVQPTWERSGSQK